ncbi:MAG TPA: tyrosine-type recombinase/integrase [Vicinamibacterales bacterium]|jgi:integrase/recombinase XerD|nr:tyrosine-type recombinase/integrase [Vicinamibacterales bacterium]
MLTAHVERYLHLRQTLGYKLRDATRGLRAFAGFAAARGDTHLRESTAVTWAAAAPSPSARYIRLRIVRHLAQFLHAEDPGHEVPPSNLFHCPKVRPLPYIYTPEEIARIVAAASHLQKAYPFRRQVYTTLLGLIAATGLRVSEALDLRLADVWPDGVLHIRHTKFGKSRHVPLHPTVVAALGRYLEARRQWPVTDDHVFVSAGNRRIAASTVNYTFRRVLRLAGITSLQSRLPRIHDLRHTFATRALEQCSTRREAVARHFVALATYLGHADITNTYWYLEATPELMRDVAAAAEALVTGEGA